LKSNTFDTPTGLNITGKLRDLIKKFNLAKVWGTSPKDYFLYRVEVTSDSSVLKLFAEEVVPKVLSAVRSVAPSKFFIIGTGVLRYDIFKGDFDQNDQLTASPYPDKFWCIPNVPLVAAIATAQKMNEKPPGVTFSSSEAEHAWPRGLMEVDQIRLGRLEAISRHPALESQDATLGYVTTDVSAPTLTRSANLAL
jgi:hypothetical protein